MTPQPSRFRLLGPTDVSEALDYLATLDVSDQELAEKGVPLLDRDFEPGLSDWQGSFLELADGTQFFVRIPNPARQ